MENKLPIGLMPHDIYEEIANKERLHDVCGAITRYYNAGLPIKIEWIEEYNELISKKDGKNRADKLNA